MWSIVIYPGSGAFFAARLGPNHREVAVVCNLLLVFNTMKYITIEFLPICLAISEKPTVESIKTQIYQMIGLPIDMQQLYLTSDPKSCLSNENTLEYYESTENGL